MHRERAALVWAILRMRHPLLASNIEMHDYDDIRLMCVQPFFLCCLPLKLRIHTATSPRLPLRMLFRTLKRRWDGNTEP